MKENFVAKFVKISCHKNFELYGNYICLKSVPVVSSNYPQ